MKMKKKNLMMKQLIKTAKTIILLILIILTFTSCNEKEEVISTSQALEQQVIEMPTPNIESNIESNSSSIVQPIPTPIIEVPIHSPIVGGMSQSLEMKLKELEENAISSNSTITSSTGISSPEQKEVDRKNQFAVDFFNWCTNHNFDAHINIETYTIFIKMDDNMVNILKTVNDPEEIKQMLDLKNFNLEGIEHLYVVINSEYMIDLKTGEIWV